MYGITKELLRIMEDGDWGDSVCSQIAEMLEEVISAVYTMDAKKYSTENEDIIDNQRAFEMVTKKLFGLYILMATTDVGVDDKTIEHAADILCSINADPDGIPELMRTMADGIVLGHKSEIESQKN